MKFEDRQSRYPGRYLVSPENGDPFYVVLERADAPRKTGTPLNAATFNALINELQDVAGARNLLDNSNFANPVNQRGGELYHGRTYTIDRWFAAGQIDVVVEDGYIELACSSTASERNGFSQSFGPEKIPEPGTVLTLACEDLDGNIIVGSAEMPESGSVAIGGTTGIGFRLYSAEEGARVSFMIPPDTATGLRWMAVYEGAFTADSLPKYRPKDYSAELMECMRYYQVRSTGNVAAVDLRPTMRAVPTITQVEGGYAYSAEL